MTIEGYSGIKKTQLFLYNSVFFAPTMKNAFFVKHSIDCEWISSLRNYNYFHQNTNKHGYMQFTRVNMEKVSNIKTKQKLFFVVLNTLKKDSEERSVIFTF